MGAHRGEVVLQPSSGSAPGRAADLELFADCAHHFTTELVLAGEVPVEGGRLDTELPRQAPQRERARALGVHERDRLLDDLVPGEAGAPTAGPTADCG